MKRVRFFVRGVVQGVNFRATAMQEGRRLGLTGRVWNRPDGSVGLVAEGDEEPLAQLERWLWRGPRSADVDAVQRSDASGDQRYSSFDVSWEPAD